MKAITLLEPSFAAFRETTLPDPQPGPGEVLVRLRAASLNFVDTAVASGAYRAPRFPLVPVADGAGEVVATGPDVRRVRVGDRVIAHAKPLWVAGPMMADTVDLVRGVDLPGSLAELVVLREEALVRSPEHLSDVEAATLPIAATTAWNALRAADIGPGKTALVLGTGGVAIFALQLAKARGARVIITSSSEERLARARVLGADHLIDYRENPEWQDEVLELSNGRGVDLVVETGGGQTFGRSITSASRGGVVFTIGFLAGVDAKVNVLDLMQKGLRIVGSNTGSVADLREAANAIAAAKITPVVDRVFAMSEVRAAYELLAKGGRHFGKVAITQ